MSRLPSSDASSSNLPKVVAAAALGALVGTRSRTAGAVVLAGLTWFATRRRAESKAQPEPSLPVEKTVPPPAGSVEDIFPASSPFIESEVPEADWDELRSALAPPPSLWPPSPPAEVPFTEFVPPRPPSSPLLQSAPVFVEFPENPPPVTLSRSAKAVLPDTISIPNTPDPPPGLLAASDTSLPPSPKQSLPPVIVPKTGVESVPPKAPQEPFGRPYVPPAPPKRKGFLGWLRSE